MNYSHHYHAGNLADVFKHMVLSALLSYLTSKDKPLCIIDSHAGSGIYNLKSERAGKTREAEEGILKLFNQVKMTELPAAVVSYFNIIQQLNNETLSTPTKEQFWYPGSPVLAEKWLRSHDQLILNEMKKADFSQLKQYFKNNSQVACHQRDAYEFLIAILPPKIRRALILIDPAYEKQHEDRIITSCVQQCLKKFNQGCYLIWYPVKTLKNDFYSLRRWLDIQKIEHLKVEFTWSTLQTENIGILGSGLLLINPPWKIQQEIAEIKAFLLNRIK